MKYTENVSVPATKYGIKWEPTARKAYSNENKKFHKNLKVTETGLHIDKALPFLGASLDGLVECDCHNPGLLEIKCPFKYQNSLNGWKGANCSPIGENGRNDS